MSQEIKTKPKIGEIILVEDVIYTSTGNRTTLIDSLQRVCAINSIGKIFVDRDIEKIQTHETLNYNLIECAEEKHKQKVQKMLAKHGLNYESIFKITTKDRKELFPQ